MTTAAHLPVVSHAGERLFSIDAAALGTLSCVFGCAMAEYRSRGGAGSPVMQVCGARRVTQSLVGGDAFVVRTCAEPLSECHSATAPPRAEAVTLLPTSSRVAVDERSGELYVFSEDRLATIDRSNRGPFLPHVHAEVRLSDSEAGRAVSVRTLTGKTFALVVAPTETVAGAMDQILEREGIPLDQQRLIFAGKQLDRARALVDYGVRDGATVHLVLRLRGGMAHRTSSRADYEELYARTVGARPTYAPVDLIVRLLNGRDVPLRVAAESSVDALKKAIVDLERGARGPCAEVDDLLERLRLARYGGAIKALGGASIVHLRRIRDDDLVEMGMGEAERAGLLAALGISGV